MFEHSLKIDNKFARNFILGGRCIFTVHNTRTKNLFVYKVTKNKNAKHLYNVYAYVKDNWTKKQFDFIGYYDYKTLTFNLDRFWQKLSIKNLPTSIHVIRYVLRHLGTLPEYYEIKYSGKCSHCNHKLIIEGQIAKGLGTHCERVVRKYFGEDMYE